MRGAPIVLLGEVHDNAAQHALRAAALERLIATGARPAIAFEQLDRERQPDVERARRERPRDADWLIAQAGGERGGWDWSMYRPFVRLALEHDLPIVAANLSRADASRVIREGWGAAFDAPTRAALGLDAVPPALLAAHEREVDVGHCGALPAAMLAPMARAQLARDAALALAIAPHAARGVVLLTGNGHARADIGVSRWLPPDLRAATRSIGLLEDDGDAGMPRGAFDVVVPTPVATREDPCAALRARIAPATQGR
ncbi:MAG: ChaN family lipoprotein [Burkholderiales bacterium]|nr:ChaN family lipoprotein [Burkholderiales bacterium]